MTLKKMLVAVLLVAGLATPARAEFPSRFDMVILDLQTLEAGERFGFEVAAGTHLSVAGQRNGQDVYTFSLDAAVVSSDQLPVTTIGVVDRVALTFTRDPIKQTIASADLNADALKQVNAYFDRPGAVNNRLGVWSERVDIFSADFIALPGENPTTHFTVHEVRVPKGAAKVATYRSEPFSFRTRDGSTVEAGFVGYDIAADDWRVPLATGFAMIGRIIEPDGTTLPLKLRKRTLAVHDISAKPYIDVKSLVPEAILGPIDEAVAFESGSSAMEAMPSWLIDVHTAALHTEMLTAAVAEGRSNPLPILALAAVVVGLDSAFTVAWNAGVDIGHVLAGEKEIGQINPFDADGPLKTKGLVGNVTYAAGAAAKGASLAIGLDPVRADALGEAVESGLDVSTILSAPNKAAANVLWGKSAHASGLVQSTYKALGTLGHQLGLSKNVMRWSDELVVAALNSSTLWSNANNIFEAGYDVAQVVQAFLNPASYRSQAEPTLAQVSLDLLQRGNEELRTLGYKFYAQVQADRFNTGAFRNAGFTLPTGSTGGFIDAAILLPLSFRLFDSGNIEDGDIVTLQVRSLNGVNIAPTNVRLTFAGRVFAPKVAVGPVEIRIVAVNEGSVPPNTGGLTILSRVVEGPSAQNFDLGQGESGILRIVAKR